MSLTSWSGFKGIVPGIDDALLGAGYARVAHNVKLCHGRLDPWREPLHTGQGGQSVHHRNCQWFVDDRCGMCYVDIEPCGDTIISGDGICPQRIKDDCTQEPLGFPCPSTPYATSIEHSEDGQFTEMAQYRIAYSDGCDVGAPSMPSGPIKYNKGDTVHVSLPQPDDKYSNVTEICIYRLASTWDVTRGMWTLQDGSEADPLQQGLADVQTEACYFLVDCVPVGTSTYVDEGNPATKQICDTLVTECYTPPPEGLKITGLTRLGSLVGFLDDELYFSERNTHYAWPDKYRIKIGCPVQHVCVHENTVFVLTDGYPFVVQDYAEAIDTWCREPRQASKPAPLASAKSVVCLDGTVLFATPWDLSAMDANAQVTKVSGEFCDDNWAAICPETMRAACWRGNYVFSTDNYSAIYQDLLTQREPSLSTIDVCAECWITTKAGDLYFAKDCQIYQWDAGPEFMFFDYETARETTSAERCITAARVVHATKRRECVPCDTIWRFKGDDCEMYCRNVSHSEIFRVPRRSTYDQSVCVRSRRSIRRLEVADSRGCFSRAVAGGTS